MDRCDARWERRMDHSEILEVSLLDDLVFALWLLLFNHLFSPLQNADTFSLSILSFSIVFIRLLPYLNGKHTVDEIVYREELRRRELRAILSQLSEEIITFVHP